MDQKTNPTDSAGVGGTNAPQTTPAKDDQTQTTQTSDTRKWEDPSDFVEFKNNEFRKGIEYTGF